MKDTVQLKSSEKSSTKLLVSGHLKRAGDSTHEFFQVIKFNDDFETCV